MKNKWQIEYTVLLLVIGIMYFMLEWNTTPTMTDDLVYHFNFAIPDDEAPQRVTNLKELLESFAGHYIKINGRLVSYIAMTVLAFVPINALSIFNSFIFVLFIYLTARVVCGKADGQMIKFTVLSVGMIFILLSGFSTTMLWHIGTINYLWVLTANLLLFLWLRRISGKQMSWHYCCWAPLAMIAGCGHEGFSVPVLAGILVYSFQHRRTIVKSALLPYFIFYFVGLLFILLSPNLWHRVGDAKSLISRIITGCVNMVFYVRILWILLLTLLFLYKRKWLNRERIKLYAPYATVLFTAYFIVFFCGESFNRIPFLAEYLSLLCLLYIWKTAGLNTFVRIVSIVIGVLSIIAYFPVLSLKMQEKADFKYDDKQMRTPGVTLIQTHITEPKGILGKAINTLYGYPFANYGYYSFYMGFNSDELIMRQIACLYGKKKMLFLPDDVANKMKNDSNAYSDFQKDSSGKLIIRKIPERQQVNGIIFYLRPENPDTLYIWQRPLAYKKDIYSLDASHWKVIRVYGHRYVIFTTPLTNVRRRIKRIELI